MRGNADTSRTPTYDQVMRTALMTAMLVVVTACGDGDASLEDAYSEANEFGPCGGSWRDAGYTADECAIACREMPTAVEPTPTGCINGLVVKVSGFTGTCVPAVLTVSWQACEQ